MPKATPSMAKALHRLYQAQQEEQPPPRITSDTARALVVRGLMTPYPDQRLTKQGAQAHQTGKVPRIITHNNVTFARLDEYSPRPSRYHCYLRKGYDLTRHAKHWELSNVETGESIWITAPKNERLTLATVLPQAAEQIRKWVARESTRRLI